MKIGQVVSCKFLDNVSFWGGIHIKKGHVIIGEAKRLEKSWVAICGLAIPLDKVQLEPPLPETQTSEADTPSTTR